MKWLRERGACYLVGTPKPQIKAFGQHLTEKDWKKASSEVDVKLYPNDGEVCPQPSMGVSKLSWTLSGQ